MRGRPPFWPAGDPVAQSVACVRPVVSPPVRRPDVRGCSPPSVVGRQFRRFGRACQASALKPAAQGRTASMGSARSSALSGRRGSGEIRFMVGASGKRPIMWVFWSDGCAVTSPPIEKAGPTHVCEAASGDERGVGTRFRPAASRLFESVHNPRVGIMCSSRRPNSSVRAALFV